MVGTTDFTESTLLDELTLLVSQAGAAIMQARRAALTARQKPDRSPVTDADEAAEEIILDGLARLLPGITVVSEESFPRRVPRPGNALVLVDPLDGTREMLAGRDEFTVNLAIVSAGRPAVGVIAAPALNIVWRANAAQAAERLHLPARRRARQPRERDIIRTRCGLQRARASWSAVRILIPRPKSFVAQWAGAERVAMRLVAEILPDRRRRGRHLSAARANIGMGHCGRRSLAGRGRRRGAHAGWRFARIWTGQPGFPGAGVHCVG